MRKEAMRWLRQAEADLKAARDSERDENYEWCCFQSQQSAEKALKAYMYNLGYTSLTTHSIKLLVKESAKKNGEFAQLDDAARILDSYYIPTRYPNGLDGNIAPVDYYDKKDAEQCLNLAALILNKVKIFIKN